MIDLSRIVVGNAAGTVKTMEDVLTMCRSGAANRITVGSITMEPRDGNAGEVYYYDERTRTSINALGIPGIGLERYGEALTYMVSAAHNNGKELWVSVAGFSPNDFSQLTLSCISCGVDGIELNLGCPNIHDKGERKPIFSYSPDLTANVLGVLWGPWSTRKLGIKISPVPDDTLPDLARVIVESGIVTEIVAVNTLPNQTMEKEDGSQALNFIPPGGSEKIHVGGLAGAPLFPEMLRVVRKLRELLPSQIRVIAVGGIFSGADALEPLQLGAAGFECATAYLTHGTPNPRVFSDIVGELAELAG